MPYVTLRPTSQYATWVNEDHSTANYRDETKANIKTAVNSNRRMYVKYDLTDFDSYFSTNIVPTTLSTIIDAYISLKCNQTSSTGEFTDTIDEPREVTAAWNSSTITWDNQPAHSTSREVETVNAIAGSVPKFHLRDVAQGWLDQSITNHGCFLISTTEDAVAEIDWQFQITRVSGTEEPFMILNFLNVDTLPAAATDNRKLFVGEAITDLNRSTIKTAEYTLTLELDD